MLIYLSMNLDLSIALFLTFVTIICNIINVEVRKTGRQDEKIK